MRAIRHELGLNQFVTFFAALLIVAQNLRQVANLQTVIAEGLAAAGRLLAALDVAPEVREAPGAPALRLTEAALRFENVGFAYAGGAPALEGVDLVARRGRVTALVGPSGGGKSTLLSLVPALLRRDAGAGDAGRAGRARRHPGLAARPHRARHPGALPVRRHDPRQHRLRPPGSRATRRWRPPPAPPPPTASSRELPQGYRHPRGRSGDAPLGRPAPARRHRPRLSEGTRPSCCSTRPPARSTPRARRRCRRRWSG